MALAAKLLVGALVLGAGSTATYVAVAGGFGAGGNGTETETSGETQVAASPAPSSSVPQPEPTARQEQPNAPAESAADSSRVDNVGADTNDQVPDAAGRETQEQSTVTSEDSGERAEKAQGDSESGEGAGIRTSVQEETGSSQTLKANSSQSLSGGSSDTENGKSQGSGSGHAVNTAASAGGNTDSGQGIKGGDVHETTEREGGSTSGGQTSNAQPQTAEQDENADRQGPSSPSVGGVVPAGTVQEATVASGTNPNSSN